MIPPSHAAAQPLYLRLMDSLYLAAIWLAGAAIVAMSLIIPWGVFTRYVLGSGSQWPEPIAILFMMVFTFVGTAAAYRAGGHIAVTMVVERLPAALQRFAAHLVDALMALACLFVGFYGARLVLETLNQSISELPWLPVGVTYAAIPIGAAITLLFVIERVFFGEQSQRAIVRYEEPSEAG